MQLNSENASTGAKLLNNAGLPANDVNWFIGALPTIRGDFAYDSALCSAFSDFGKKLRAQLSKKAQRNPDEAAANEFIHQTERELRDRFLAAHIETFHDKLTNRGSKFLRVAIGVRSRTNRTRLGPKCGSSSLRARTFAQGQGRSGD